MTKQKRSDGTAFGAVEAEAYTIRIDSTPATWTRDNIQFAKLLAQDLANKTEQRVTVTLAATGRVGFVAMPEAGEAAA